MLPVQPTGIGLSPFRGASLNSSSTSSASTIVPRDSSYLRNKYPTQPIMSDAVACPFAFTLSQSECLKKKDAREFCHTRVASPSHQLSSSGTRKKFCRVHVRLPLFRKNGSITPSPRSTLRETTGRNSRLSDWPHQSLRNAVRAEARHHLGRVPTRPFYRDGSV